MGPDLSRAVELIQGQLRAVLALQFLGTAPGLIASTLNLRAHEDVLEGWLTARPLVTTLPPSLIAGTVASLVIAVGSGSLAAYATSRVIARAHLGDRAEVGAEVRYAWARLPATLAVGAGVALAFLLALAGLAAAAGLAGAGVGIGSAFGALAGVAAGLVGFILVVSVGYGVIRFLPRVLLALPALAVEDDGVQTAFGRGWSLSMGAEGRLWGLITVVWGLQVVAGVCGLVVPVASAAFSAASSIVGGAVGVSTLTVMYFERRAARGESVAPAD